METKTAETAASTLGVTSEHVSSSRYLCYSHNYFHGEAMNDMMFEVIEIPLSVILSPTL